VQLGGVMSPQRMPRGDDFQSTNTAGVDGIVFTWRKR